MASSDSSEIVIWDTRNLSKRLFTIKSDNIDEMDFLEGNTPTFMVSSGNDVKVLDLKNKEENYESVS